MRDSQAQALIFLKEGNLALQADKHGEAIASYSSGLNLLPQSCGLLLNRSIAHERAYQKRGVDQHKTAAFQDLQAYLNLTTEEDDEQNQIVLKRFINLGIALNQLRSTLWQLKQLEEKHFWHSIDFYDVLIGLILVNPGSEDSLTHYVMRASQFACLSAKTLERVCEFLALHSSDQDPQTLSHFSQDSVESLLLEIVFSDHAPPFLLSIWLEYVLPKLPTQESRVSKLVQVLSLWMAHHELDEEFAEILINASINQNQIDCAEAILLELANRFPEKSQYMLGLVKTRLYKRDPKNAFVIISTLLDTDPENVELRLQRAKITQHINNPEMSLADINQILAINPHHLASLLLKVDTLTDLGRLDEALALHEQIVQHHLTSSERLDLAVQKSFTYRIAGLEQKWFAQVDAIVKEFPDCPQTYCEMGLKELYLGDWKPGFAHLESRFVVQSHYYAIKPHLEKSQLEDWSPEILANNVVGKRLLLTSEEGLGDAFQYARFISLLLDKGLKITLVCADALQSFLAFNYPEITIKTKQQFFEELLTVLNKGFDFYGSLLSAPYALGIELRNLDAKAYLKADPDKVNEWLQKMPQLLTQKSHQLNEADNRLVIGLRWVGNFSRAARKIPLECFAPLANLPIAIVGLQFGKLSAEDQVLIEQWDNFYHTNLAIDDLAALMMHLDCVVTCDTLTAHLAGALGRPTILIKPVFGYWVWGQSGHQSVWYDSMYIIRQSQFLNWDSAITELIEQIQFKIKAKNLNS